MPNIKSAKKRMVQNEIRRDRNRQRRSRIRTEIKRFQDLLSAQKTDEAQELLKKVYSVIDRSAQKGVIHSNTAARYKSQLTKRLTDPVS
ncbi:MAG: 30S ribosomal protein S20 [Acidobacteriota bacterium]|nr:30S ribosomal protein S20 [Acidobacteriota bacterium]